ncbi:hypothetical protein I79_018238 [Cricetulus griseus]|uniref:Uncharacterized protein n=1 Tax=Cricetulus griseus TaxID=10029 RepID=G3I462_CRIGR|nr:hypothetical protein I79_018238 [Cricetulus griseus]
MIYFLEQKVKSYGVEWGQRVEPCHVHLALRSSTGSILDVLGMVRLLQTQGKIPVKAAMSLHCFQG